jgi:hypothetical protein
MRMRDLLTSGVFLAVLVLHFGTQWYAWKVHLKEVPVEDRVVDSSGDSLWRVCSFPVFAIVPRRTQNLRFFELLAANSMLWSIVLSWCVYTSLRRLRKPRRGARQRVGRASPAPLKPSAAAPTRTDRLVELKRLRDQGLITREEYQQQRTAILTDL